MLFNSLEFILLFLPLVLVGYYALIRFGLRGQIFRYLVFISLAFYAVWNPPYVLLLLGSMGGNYACSVAIHRAREAKRRTAPLLGLGIAANLAVLGWFKYANFFAGNLDIELARILLPLAISFYTLQQVAYLVDVARGEVKPGGIWRFATFVIFFPQLIAGPIVHYREMMPQFFGRALGRFPGANLTVGFTIFSIGLFKKTVIADTAALFASPVYDAALAGEPIGLLAAWTAAACYTVQLYFDFSGYSDMAIGLARMFGVRLPLNFHSPLRAASVIEYWRRWHMTLQQFIVAYMFQPLVLPLTRLAAMKGWGKWKSFAAASAAPSVLIFMVIGFWHGANWTFVVFGLMHGIYTATNEFWRAWRRKARRKLKGNLGLPSVVFYHALTLVCVMAANVVFRAESLEAAGRIWFGMLRIDQILTLPAALPAAATELVTEPLAFLAFAVALIALFPNTQQIMGRYRPALEWDRWRNVAPPRIMFRWRPTALWALWTGAAFFLGLAFVLRGESEFIYFNF